MSDVGWSPMESHTYICQAPLTSAATPPAWDDRPANTEHDDHLSTSPARSYALGMGPVEPVSHVPLDAS